MRLWASIYATTGSKRCLTFRFRRARLHARRLQRAVSLLLLDGQRQFLSLLDYRFRFHALEATRDQGDAVRRNSVREIKRACDLVVGSVLALRIVPWAVAAGFAIEIGLICRRTGCANLYAFAGEQIVPRKANSLVLDVCSDLLLLDQLKRTIFEN